jgi:hypothetical protein
VRRNTLIKLSLKLVKLKFKRRARGNALRAPGERGTRGSPGEGHRVGVAGGGGPHAGAPPGESHVREGETARAQARGKGRGKGREGEEERGEGEGSSPWDPKSGDNRPPDHLGKRGEREVEERERELLRGKTK